MLKKVSKIFILTLALLLAFTTCFNMPLSQLDVAYAGGGDDGHREEKYQLKDYGSTLYDYNAMANTTISQSFEKIAGDTLCAMLFDTGRQRGDIVQFIMIKYKDATNGNSRIRRLNPNFQFSGSNTNNRIKDSNIKYYEGKVAEAKKNYEDYKAQYEYYSSGDLGVIYKAVANAYKNLMEQWKKDWDNYSMVLNQLKGARASAEKYANTIMGSYKGVTDNVELTTRAANSKKAEIGLMNGSPTYGAMPALFAADTTSVAFFRMNKADLRNLEGIYVYLSQGDGRLESWAINRWEIYTIDDSQDIGMDMFSSVSEQTFLNFSGWKEFEVANLQGEIAIDSQFNEQYTNCDCNMLYWPVEGEKVIKGNDSKVFEEEFVQPLVEDTYPRVVKYSNSPSALYSSGTKDNYTVVMNIPDIYAGGINLLNKDPLTAGFTPKEQIYATFSYELTNGEPRDITIPVITNALVKAVENIDGVRQTFTEQKKALSGNEYQNALKLEVQTNRNKFNTGQVLSYAQQGEKLVFDVKLPNCKVLNSVSFKYEAHEADGDKVDDFLAVNAIKIYHEQDIAVDYDYNYFLKANPRPTTSPAYSFTTSYWKGTQIACGSEEYFDLMPGGNNNYFATEEPESTRYLVVLDTFKDTMGRSGTADSIIFALKYKSVSGTDEYSTECVLKESAEDYYGYWTGQLMTASRTDAAYQYGMRSGGEFCFVMESNDISEITGFTARLEDDCDDDWQLDRLQVYRLESLSARIPISQQQANYNYAKETNPSSQIGLLNAQKVVTANGITIDRQYYRDFTGDLLCDEGELYALVQKDTPIDYDFAGDVESEKKTRDYSQYYYEMDWTTANGEMDWMEQAKTYTVNVSIPSNRTQGVVDDGCGSKNLVYFQLVFKRGSSGYILANTQMTTDGFIPGVTSSFTIATNEDLGEVVGMNIIIDDLDENSDVLDKLFIDEIEIIKNNPTGVCRRSVCEVKSWISKDYHSSDESAMKQKVIGRPLNELVVTFPVTYSAYMLKYQFTISTHADSKSQYVGPLIADIQYYNGKNELKTLRNFDIVKAIYEYNNRTPQVKNEVYVSDPDTMFIPGHTDRFFVSLSDATSFKNIILRSNEPGTDFEWSISDMSISIITTDAAKARRIVNEDGEYEMHFKSDEISFLTATITNLKLPYTWKISNAIKNQKEFDFDPKNKIPEIEHEEKVIATVSRVPESANDTANIYVYMSKDASDPQEYKHQLKASLFWSGEQNNHSNEKIGLSRTMVDGRIVMVASGINMGDFKKLNSVTITSSVLKDGKKPNYNCKVDQVVVQRMRGNVVVSTDVFTFLGGDASQSSKGISSDARTDLSLLDYYQELTLILGEDTFSGALEPMTHDLAVRLDYYGENEPKLNSTGTVFQSPYIYVTDQLGENYEMKPGATIKLKFSEPYLKSVKSIHLVGTDGLNVEVESAYIDEYKKTSAASPSNLIKSEVCTRCGSIAVTGTTFDVDKSAGNLTRASFTFHTSNASSGNTGTSLPVKLQIKYKKPSGEIATKTIKDITVYAQDGKFTTGNTDTMDFSLFDVEEIRSITIDPTDSWFVDNIKLSYNYFKTENGVTTNVKEDKEIAVKDPIYNGNPYSANFCNISVSANAIVGKTNKTVVDKEMEPILVAPGSEVKIKIKISGSLDGQGYTVSEEKVVGNATSYEGGSVEAKNSGEYTFTAPQEVTEPEQYRVVITSNENESKKAIVPITVSK